MVHGVHEAYIRKPELNIDLIPVEIEKPCNFLQPQVETPKTLESLMSLRKRIEESIAQSGDFDGPCKKKKSKN
jgi:hypothetical protein